MKKLLLTIITLALALGFSLATSDAVVLDEKAPQGQLIPTEDAPKYAPGEVIIKFKAPNGKLLDDLKDKSQKKEDLTLDYKSIKDIKDIPDKVKTLLKDDTTLEPVFKGLHRKMRIHKKTEEQLNKETFDNLAKKRNLKSKEPKNYHLSDVYILRKIDTKGKLIEELCEELQNDPSVEYAQPNYIVSIDLTPNDPLYPIQWPLNNTGQVYPASGRFNTPPGTPDCDIDAPEAWDINTGNSNIVVAVVDTGVDYNHRDLDNNMWKNLAELSGTPAVDDDGNGYVDDIYGYDFGNDDPDPIDDNGHGTHVSGTIAAEGDNNLDITGVCWNAKIMALKFLGAGGSGFIDDALDAFYYAADNGANITSNSWGGGGYSQTDQDVINYAHDQGLVMIASAGNNPTSEPHYPAAYENVIAVIATDSNDQKATFSTYGEWADISAPGVDILSLRAAGTSRGTVYDDYTTVASGTSMACPHVSGLAALILSKWPSMSSDIV